MDKLKQIEAFVAATDGGSLAKAALKAQVTPVMIGRRIDALERRLGVRLLHRSTRRLALTEEGATYLEQCRRLLADLDQVESLLGGGHHRATGHLIVSAPASCAIVHRAESRSARVVWPHRSGHRSRTPWIRHGYTDRRRNRSQFRRDQARCESARGLRDAG